MNEVYKFRCQFKGTWGYFPDMEDYYYHFNEMPALLVMTNMYRGLEQDQLLTLSERLFDDTI